MRELEQRDRNFLVRIMNEELAHSSLPDTAGARVVYMAMMRRALAYGRVIHEQEQEGG
jgi:hypothetical protein